MAISSWRTIMRLGLVFGLAGFGLLGLALLLPARTPQPGTIGVQQTDQDIRIETDALQALIRKKGYVTGIAAGTFIDRKTGSHDLGFGLHIMDFLMAPGWREDGYPREANIHGNLPKHYIEGPQ